MILAFFFFLSSLTVFLHLSYQSSGSFLVSLFRTKFRFFYDIFLFLIDSLTLLFAHAAFLLFFLKSSLEMYAFVLHLYMRLQNYSQTSSKDIVFSSAPFNFVLSSFLTLMMFALLIIT